MQARTYQQRSVASNNLVAFQVAGATYAVDIHRVREVVLPSVISPLPDAPRCVLGVADVRGAVLPVIDLRVRFGEPPAPPALRRKWLLVEDTGGGVVLVADQVREVFAASAAEQGTIPPVATESADRGIVATCRRLGGVVFVVDVDRVVAPVRGAAPRRGAP